MLRIVADGRDRRRARHHRVDNHADCSRRAASAVGVSLRDRDLMAAVGQRAGRVRPAPAGIGRHRPDRLSIDENRDLRVRLRARARDRRRAVTRHDARVSADRLLGNRLDREPSGRRAAAQPSHATGATAVAAPAAGRGRRNPAGRRNTAEYPEERAGRQPVADRRIRDGRLDNAVAARLQRGAEVDEKTSVVLHEHEIVIIDAVFEERLHAQRSAILEFDDQVVPGPRVIGDVLFMSRQQEVGGTAGRRCALRAGSDRDIDVIAQDGRGNHCRTPCDGVAKRRPASCGRSCGHTVAAGPTVTRLALRKTDGRAVRT
ncbi:hypothetical protein FEP54_01492 [Burkholderia multivorans]|nr:hypothetical protein [Burkholderia multivorans]MDR8922783.1 hypothetical protein [Burkholderia multivorans]MDR9020654.1 hypothetical protein [Burkholderia multivorans]MDR9029988.1 hypothetical protein [Burkholderia multivorans]MDR9032934.1 hypothetical protein [Burkholderia multivorans]